MSTSNPDIIKYIAMVMGDAEIFSSFSGKNAGHQLFISL